MNKDIKTRLSVELGYALCGNSGVSVAALLVAQDKRGETAEFTGANIEVARGIVYHAEEVALIKALNEGYTKPLHIYLTSPSDAHRVPMCLICRGKFFYVNCDCVVTVLNTKFEPALTTTVRESVNYPYFGRGFIS